MEQHVGNLRWVCSCCGSTIDLPKEVRCPKIPGQTITQPEWKWSKGHLKHRCRGKYSYCRPSALRRRFIVIPGRVVSIFDRQVHHITADQLMDLYKVRRCECVVASPMETMDNDRLNRIIDSKGLIPLCPRGDGNYDLKSVGQVELF